MQAVGRHGLERALCAIGRRGGRRLSAAAAMREAPYRCLAAAAAAAPPLLPGDTTTTTGRRRRRRPLGEHEASSAAAAAVALVPFSSNAPFRPAPWQLLQPQQARRGLATQTTPSKPRPPPSGQQQPPSKADSTAPTTAVSLVDRMPRALQPYLRLMRVDKPVGTWLLLWPGYWSIAMAAAPGALPDPTLLAVFGVGALVMRSAGCTVNDLWDRDVDKHVARTKHRPITSGEISVRNGVVFLGAQLLVGLGVLLQLNEPTVLLGCASVPLVIAYPLMKRYMGYPQLFLGMTFNWGALMGWSAVHGSCAWPVVLPLYTAALSWTVVYDTLYAHQDKHDDARLGLRSTALTFGDDTKPILALFSGLTVAGLTVAGWQAGLAWPYYLGATCFTTAHLAWQLGTADLNDAKNLAARFEANKWLGGVVFASAVAGRLLA